MRMPRIHVCLRSALAGVTLALAGGASQAADGLDRWRETPSPSTGALTAEVLVGQATGEFGSDVETDLWSIVPRLGWSGGRALVRLSVPFVRVESEGDVRLVDGRPIVPGLDPDLPGSLGGAPEPGSRDRRSISGRGDVRLLTELDLARGSATRPRISLLGEVKLPTADEAAGLGTGETDLTGGVGLAQPLGRTSLLFETRYTAIGDPADLELDDVVALAGGLARRVGRGQVHLQVERRTSAIPGEEARVDAGIGGTLRVGPRDGLRVRGAVLVGVDGPTEDHAVTVGLGRGL